MSLLAAVTSMVVRTGFVAAFVNAAQPAGARARRAGFTLLELLVVMVILGLLAAYVGPRYFSQVGRSEQSLARAQIESFSRALDAYRLDLGHYPSTEEGLQALMQAPAGLTQPEKWNGPYLQKGVPLDPWGRAYLYRATEGPQPFELMSLGKDGLPGGSGDAADIRRD